MLPPYQDGPFPSGAPVLTINSVEYICNSFQPDDSANTVNVTNNEGAHSGAVSFKGPTTGSAELQLATSTTAVPTTAAAATATGTFTVDTVVYFITAVSKPRTSGGVWVVNIQFQARVNAV